MSDDFLPETAYAFLNAAPERMARPSGCQETTHPGGQRNGRPTAAERCRLYLAKVDPAVSGQGGHDQTMKAACLIPRFGIPNDGMAWQLFSEYNARCLPPWSAKETPP